MEREKKKKNTPKPKVNIWPRGGGNDGKDPIVHFVKTPPHMASW